MAGWLVRTIRPAINGRLVTGMGIDFVANLYYECQLHLLSSGANYTMLYFALQQAAINLGCTETQRKNIDMACRAVEIRPTAFISITDNNNQPLVRFADAGDVIMQRGTILTEQNLAAKPNVSGCVFSDAQGNAVANVDPVSGNLCLKGKLYQGISRACVPPAGALTIRRADDVVVAFMNPEAYTDSRLEVSGNVPAGSLMLLGNTICLGS